jgi:site-specific recombinase XerD
MSDTRQMPLFPPQTEDDINRHTSLQATLPLFERYLNREGKSEHTVKAFAADLRLVGEFLGEDMAVSQFTTSNLNHFLEWLEIGRGVPCSRKSYARRVTTIKVYFKWLHSIRAIRHDPAKAILQRSGPAPLSEVLSPEQIDAAIAFSQTVQRKDEHDYRPEFLFRLLVNTGIKKSEAARLTLDDIDRANPQRPILYVRQRTRNVYKERRIQLDSDLLELLDRYVEQYGLETVIFDCTSRNLEYILTDIGEGAKIPFKLSFEVMRWTSAVRDYRNGVDEQAIREKLGLSEASWYETSRKIKRLAERLETAAEE